MKHNDIAVSAGTSAQQQFNRCLKQSIITQNEPPVRHEILKRTKLPTVFLHSETF